MEFENPRENVNSLIRKMADPLVFEKICSSYMKKRKKYNQELKSCEMKKSDKSLTFNEAEECMKILSFSTETFGSNNYNVCEKVVCKGSIPAPTPVQRFTHSIPNFRKSKQDYDLHIRQGCSKDSNCCGLCKCKIVCPIDSCTVRKNSEVKHVSNHAKCDAVHVNKHYSTLENIVVLSSDSSSEDETTEYKKIVSNVRYKSDLRKVRNKSLPSPAKINVQNQSKLNYSNASNNHVSFEQNNSSSIKSLLTDYKSFDGNNSEYKAKSTLKLNPTLPSECEILSTNEASELAISNLIRTKSFKERNHKLKSGKAKLCANFSDANNHSSVFQKKKCLSVSSNLYSSLKNDDLITLSSDDSEDEKEIIVEPKTKIIQRLKKKNKSGISKKHSKSKNVYQNRTSNSVEIPKHVPATHVQKDSKNGIAELQRDVVQVLNESTNNSSRDATTSLYTLNYSSNSDFHAKNNLSTHASDKLRSTLSPRKKINRKISCLPYRFSNESKPSKIYNPTKFATEKAKIASTDNLQNKQNNVEIGKTFNASIGNSMSEIRASSSESFVKKKQDINEAQTSARNLSFLDSKKLFDPGLFTLKSTMVDTAGSQLQLKDLDFVPEPVTFKIPKLHENERVHWLSKEDRKKLTDECIDIKLGRWSPEEDKILKRNFLKFCTDFSINDPDFILGINNDLKKNSMLCQFLRAKHFYLRLGRDLNNRMLNSIYQRARKLFCKVNRSKWGFKDVSKLIQLQRQLGSDWHAIGKILKRDSEQCRNIFIYLKNNNKIDNILKNCIK